MIYLFITILLVFLIFHFDVNNNKKNRTLSYNFVLVILIFISGLRWRIGTDTIGTLTQFYYYTPKLENFFKWESFGVHAFLWKFFMSFFFTFGGRFYLVQLFQAIIVNALIFKYFKKHSKYIFTCVFLYFIWMYTTYNMEEMKASLSVVFMLYANDYILDKKYKKSLMLSVLACLFHFSTILLIFTPLFLFLRINKISIFLLITLYFIGGYVQELIGDYIMAFDFGEDISSKIELYTETEKYFGGKALFKILVLDLPIIIYSLLSVIYIKRQGVSNEILKYEPLLIMGLGFLVLSLNIMIFYRYYHFFSVYIIMFISEFFRLYGKTKKKGSIKPYMAFIVLFPLIVSMTYRYKHVYYRYYPYCSVINRQLDHLREQKQYEYHPNRVPPNIERY